jgi:Kef-type K+ transport system membrane component KefB
MTNPTAPKSRLWGFAGYGLLLGGVVLLFLLISDYGEGLSAPAAVGSAAVKSPQLDILPHVLLAMVAVILVARLVGMLFRYLRQPPVIGEVIAGIMLGPSLLGRIAPEASAYILPKAVAPALGIIAQLGVVLYMFLVGLELDTGLLRKKSHSTIAISHASISVPFILGAAMALWLYPLLSNDGVPFAVFAMFLGVSMSVTAFPVLARILTDQRLHRTRLGVIALTCAAADDVTAWCLLAFVVSFAQAEPSRALVTAGLTVGYIGFMFVAVRPLAARLARYCEEKGTLTQGVTALIFVALLLSSLITEFIGIHAIFGAFLLGAIIPHDSVITREINTKLGDLIVVLLLPAFFAFTGMRTEIGLVAGGAEWLICGVIIALASIGKFGGSLAAARLTGMDWRDSAAIGILMNTRGLMELIVLNIGLDLGVISPTLFAMLVIMAIVTTMATAPILHWLTRSEGPSPARAGEGAEEARLAG